MRSLFTPGLIAAVSVYVLLRALLLHTAFDETVMRQLMANSKRAFGLSEA